MTNSEAIKILEMERIFRNGSNLKVEAIDIAISALEENDKLKAEIEKLKGELKSEREFRANVRIELLDRKTEIEQLKSELEQVTKLMPKICETCEHEEEIGWKEPCNSCKNGNNWKLKGQVEE